MLSVYMELACLTLMLGSAGNINENHDSGTYEENVVSRRTMDYEAFLNIVGVDCTNVY
jgi:hypothetical protein